MLVPTARPCVAAVHVDTSYESISRTVLLQSWSETSVLKITADRPRAVRKVHRRAAVGPRENLGNTVKRARPSLTGRAAAERDHRLAATAVIVYSCPTRAPVLVFYGDIVTI